MPSGIVMMDAGPLAAAIRSKKVSCVEVMTAYLDHIDALNPKVNAIVALQDRAGLLAQARERDARWRAARQSGPLHGFPHAVKDLAPVKGIRTTMGSPIFKDNVPAADSAMVARAARGRRDLHRQDQHAGVRSRLEHLQSCLWHHPQCL